MLRPAPLLIAAAALALSLTACSGTPSETNSPSPSATPTATPSVTPTASPTPTPTPIPVSTSLDAIKVTGEPPAIPKVQVPAPFAIDQTRSKVLVPGTGPKVLADGIVTVHYYGVNGRTGQMFQESYSGKTPATFPLGQVIPGFKKGLTDQLKGSRVLIAMPGADAYDAAPDSGPTGYQKGDTLIFVVDIIDTSVAAASGTAVTPPAGLPTVTGKGADQPTVVIPDTAPPTKMVAQTLIEGTGTKVAADDTIHARYVGYSWKTGDLVDDGWDTPTTGALKDLIPGWTKGLEGKPVGSRVLLVLPPADGYPEGSNNPPIEKGDTVVYVVDLLYTF